SFVFCFSNPWAWPRSTTTSASTCWSGPFATLRVDPNVSGWINTLFSKGNQTQEMIFMKFSMRRLFGSGLLGLAVACAGLAATSVQAQDGDKDPITFATLLDFTAVYTFLTDEYSQGQQDYIKLLNQEGGINGHPVELIVRDHGSQPQNGIALYEKALDKGAVLFDFLSTPVSRALVPRVLEDQVPMLTYLHGRADASNGEVFPYVFVASATYWSQAAILMQYMKEHEDGLEGKKVAHVYIDSPFGQEPIPLLKAIAEQEGATLKTFPYPSPGTEQSSTWTSVRRFQPDYVIIWGAGPSQAVSIRQAIRNGIQPEQIHSVVWLSETDMNSINADVAGVKRYSATVTGTDTPVLQRIVD